VAGLKIEQIDVNEMQAPRRTRLRALAASVQISIFRPKD